MVIEEASLGTVRVFGTFGVRDTGGEAVRLPARSASALAAYLALRWRGAARHEIAETLWPGGEHEQARAALRTAVHRIRQTLGEGALVDEEGRLRLAFDSDVLRAARLRRRRRRAAHADEAIAAAREEWAIVRQEVLAGWNDEWIEPLRDDARLLANECALALARLLEERGEAAAALEALDGILGAIPHHTEALEAAMRLENGLHGRERALARAADARASLPPGEGLTLPGSIRRLERALRDGASGFLPPPEAFADGADLALIGHMVEGSLRQGGTAALTLLAEQAFSPVCLRHPYRTLDLLRRAISLTTGDSPERTAVMVAAVQHAQFANDREAVHEICDDLIRAFPPESLYHNGSLTVKAGAYLQARDFERARSYAAMAVDGCTTEDRRSVALAQVAIVDLQELRFDPAIERLESALAMLRRSSREDRDRNQVSILGILCEAYAVCGEWSRAVEWGEQACAFAATVPSLVSRVSGTLGLALIHEGRPSEGIARLRTGLLETHRERMRESFVTGLDLTALALDRFGRREVADAVLDAANVLRHRVLFPRSPAEGQILEAGGLDPRTVHPGPLRHQSPGALSEWLGETLERSL